VIAYFGLLSRSKGADLLLDALAQLAPTSPPVRLLLIGGSATAPHDRAFADALHAQIARSPLAAQIIRTGHVAAPDVSAHLLASDAVVLPFRTGASFRSGSLLAALTHGTAIVTTHSDEPVAPAATAPHAWPTLRDGEHALLVPPNDSTALAQAIERLRADPALRARLGAAAQRLGAWFGWERIAQAHRAVYTGCRS
jgi:glycosyltransferase involved in cell wall biosynthesis